MANNDIPLCIPTQCKNAGFMCGMCERKSRIGNSGVSYGMMIQDLYYRRPRVKAVAQSIRPGQKPYTLEVIFAEGIAIYDYNTKTLEKKNDI